MDWAWFQVADDQGINLAHVESWLIPEPGIVRVLGRNHGDEGWPEWTLKGDYATRFLDMVGYVAPGKCRNCGGEGTLTVGSMSGARELDCEPCGGSGEASKWAPQNSNSTTTSATPAIVAETDAWMRIRR